jgi:hypothetical protein
MRAEPQYPLELSHLLPQGNVWNRQLRRSLRRERFVLILTESTLLFFWEVFFFFLIHFVHRLLSLLLSSFVMLMINTNRDEEYKGNDISSAGLSRERIEALRTIRGGWTRKQLEEWGIEWPPKKGWKRELEKRAEKSGLKLF